MEPRSLDTVPAVDVNVIESKARVDVRAEDAELRHRPNHIGLLNDSDAVYGPRRVSLDNVDFKPALP
jgi:hypothetical protein